MLNEDAKIKNVLGKTGSGKTLICTEDWGIPALIDGEEVYADFFINWKLPNYHYFAPKDFESIKNVRNAVFLFDEYRQSFDPRNYQGESEDVRSFFELHRHRHNDIRGNTQDVSLVAKTIGIQAHDWSQVERIEDNWVYRIIDKIKGKQYIRIRQDYLTFQELKKMANGWELGEDVAIEADWEIRKFDVEKLIHKELDEYKKELIYSYCPKCHMRQGFMIKDNHGFDIEKDQILAEETENYATKIMDNYRKNLYHYEWKEPRFCCRENHKDVKLEIKLAGMFDTDYEPEQPEIQYTLRKYVKCGSCGIEHWVK